MNRGFSSPILPTLTPAARALMLVVGGLFLLQVLARVVLGFDGLRYAELIEQNVSLSATGVLEDGRAWTLLTWFWFSPLNGIFGVLLALLMLWIFAPALEMRVGPARVIAAFVFAGVIAGLASFGLAALLGPSSPTWAWSLLGPSAATSGLAAFLFWLERNTTFHVFVAEAKGKQLLLFFALLQVLQGAITHPFAALAPLAAMAAGVLSANSQDPWRLWQQFKLWRIRRRVRLIAGGKDDRDFLK